MTQRQIDALSALLQRVQTNRKAPRPRRSAVAVAAAPAPALRVEPVPASDDFSDLTPAPPPAPPPRRPGMDRRATPLEMAVAGELEQQLAAASEARAIASPAASAANREAIAAMDPRAEARREAPVAQPRREPPAAEPRREAPAARPVRAVEPVPEVAHALQPVDPASIEPRIIEPDPPREVVRPIAQVVSKHAPAVDATFGAMLKRSLSLRPH